MKIAIVHYHLQPGGVTRIIQHQVATLAEKDVDVVVLTGKRPPGNFPGSWRVVSGLQYDDDRPLRTEKELLADMVSAAKDALGDVPDLWHIHNHSLGKNMILPSVIKELANSGYCLLLQLHDFAEDGRPVNYRTMVQDIGGGCKEKLSMTLYPKAEHVHYCVLNGRDYNFLTDADEDPINVHLLNNPVELNIDAGRRVPVDKVERNLWMYPTRAIRRKNIGEFLLWAAVAEKDQRFATTLGPDNPREWQRYSRWKKIAHDLKLPIEFEMGAKHSVSFVELLQQARVLVTTSVAEGFGMAFLEPWLAHRPVAGRNLTEITGDFCQNGICLPWNYERLEVPVAWVGRNNIIAAARKGLEQSMASYGRPFEKDALDRALAHWIRDDMVDFGRLNEELQEKILYHLAACTTEKGSLQPASLMAAEVKETVIEDNCRILAEHYSLERYGDKLHLLYQNIVASKVSPVSSLCGEKLLTSFLAPERLQLLQVD